MKCVTAVLLLIVFIAAAKDLHYTYLTNYTNITEVPELKEECQSDGKCSFFIGSSCKTDPQSGKKICLCWDMTKPRGKGSCRHSKKGIGEDCTVDEDCIPGAVCEMQKVSSYFTSCQCMECYAENNHLCVWTDNQNCSVVTATASGVRAGFLIFIYPILHFVKI
ncbi:hypothetical protein L9F63_003219 [Diploptera punctata]|uniref:EGF-like domain-containing protein n=1 Tax=Diploptera punctata TaxID=6984 RepID=A0AAD7ZL96_DIPPU|nr:hypothetical protein L9F63_003219 [Diploptera punctata]